MHLAIFLLGLVKFIVTKNAYVVQTSDEKLHFITDHIETYQLPFEQAIDSPNTGLTLPSHRELPGLHDSNNENGHLARINRLDKIFVNSDGFIEFLNLKIPIKDLLHTPFVEQGIYISATQENYPTILNNTIVILSYTRIFLLDFYDYSSKVLRFKQVLYLYQIYENIPMTDKKVLLNESWWTFNSSIVAVFRIEEKDGINFMLKIVNKSDLVNYSYSRPEKKSRKGIIVLIILIIPIVLYFTKHLKYSTTIIKNKLFLGKFVKKDCLIYKVCIMDLKEHREMHEKVKNPCFVHIYYESEGFFNPLIVTEKTFQFKPEFKNTEVEQSSVSSYNLDITNISVLTDKFPKECFAESSKVKNDILKSAIHKIITYFEQLHSMGVVHSQICPENIRLTMQDNIKIQRIFDNSGWKSINQLKNIKKKNYKVQESDDIFSLGCVIHYYLTGYHPFDLRNFVKKDRKASKKITEFEVDTQNNNELELLENESDINQNDDNQVLTDNKNEEHVLQTSKTNKAIDLLSNSINQLSKRIVNLKIYMLNTIEACQCLIFEKLLLNQAIRIINDSYQRIKSFLRPCLNLIGIWPKKFNKSEIEAIYKKIIPEDKINYIDYNVMFSTFRIRLEDQVEHDFIYHSIKIQDDNRKLKLSAHPYFWDDSKSLEFICDVSDFLESNTNFKPRLERVKKVVFQGSWLDYLDTNLIKAGSIKRTYDFNSLCDMIRFIRNINRHFQEINSNSAFKALEGRLFSYFSQIFPELLMLLYRNGSFKDQYVFKKYYE